MSGAHTEVSGAVRDRLQRRRGERLTFGDTAGPADDQQGQSAVPVSATTFPSRDAARCAGFAYGVGGTGDVLAPAVTFSYAGAGSTLYGPTATAPPVGSYTVTASYGQRRLNAGSSGAVAFGIGLHSQTLTFVLPSLSKSFGDAAFSVASYASASSGLPVSFASQTTSVCTTGGSNGATVTLVGAGTCTIRASQNGDGYFAAAPMVDQSFPVTLSGTLQIQHVTAVAPTVIDVLADPLLVGAIGSGGQPLTILPDLTQATSGRVTTDGHTVTYEPYGCSTDTDSFKFTASNGVSNLQVPVAVIVDKPGVNGQPPTPMTSAPTAALTTGILGSTVPVKVAWCGVVATKLRPISPYTLRQTSDGGVTFPSVYTGTATSIIARPRLRALVRMEGADD